MKMKHKAILPGAVSIATFLFLLGCVEEQAPPDQAAIDNGESLIERNAIEDFLPVGSHKATFYTWLIGELGKGSVTIRDDGGTRVVEVTDHRGITIGFKLAADLSSCEFEGVSLAPSGTKFQRKDGGALGSRVDRVWKNYRLTVLVGRSLQDNQNVLYLNDRWTNDILVVAKYSPQASEAEQDGGE